MPYVLTGSLTVPAGVNLTVEAGAVVGPDVSADARRLLDEAGQPGADDQSRKDKP